VHGNSIESLSTSCGHSGNSCTTGRGLRDPACHSVHITGFRISLGLLSQHSGRHHGRPGLSKRVNVNSYFSLRPRSFQRVGLHSGQPADRGETPHNQRCHSITHVVGLDCAPTGELPRANLARCDCRYHHDRKFVSGQQPRKTDSLEDSRQAPDHGSTNMALVPVRMSVLGKIRGTRTEVVSRRGANAADYQHYCALRYWPMRLMMPPARNSSDKHLSSRLSS
jgi:hypothetical protein